MLVNIVEGQSRLGFDKGADLRLTNLKKRLWMIAEKRAKCIIYIDHLDHSLPLVGMPSESSMEVNDLES